MDDNRRTLITSISGNMFAAVMHGLCALSMWCSLIFPIVPIMFLFLEKNKTARRSCIQAIAVCLCNVLLSVVPTVLWLVIYWASKASGTFFVICTVAYALVLLMLCFVFFVVEAVSAIKAYRKEPVEIPYISKLADKFSQKSD